MKKICKRLLSAICLIAILAYCIPVTADAKRNTSSLALRKTDTDEIVPFHAANLFSGEQVIKEYTVETRHDAPHRLYFHGDIRSNPQYQKLAEVLMVTVALSESDRILYSGLMAKMPQSLGIDCPAGTHQITYRITVWLEPSVGNAYMDQELTADFRWWFLDQTGTAVTITAEKLLDKKYARGSKFTFLLMDEQGRVVSTVKNKDGHIAFETLYFDAPGTYTYTFCEKKGSDTGITYDGAQYKAIIQVLQDGSWKVSYTRNGERYDTGLPRFVNVTKGNPVPDHPSDVTPENPKTGDSFPLYLLAASGFGSLTALLCLLLLWKGRQQEDAV